MSDRIRLQSVSVLSSEVTSMARKLTIHALKSLVLGSVLLGAFVLGTVTSADVTAASSDQAQARSGGEADPTNPIPWKS
jgi:hypothetical protein